MIVIEAIGKMMAELKTIQDSGAIPRVEPAS